MQPIFGDNSTDTVSRNVTSTNTACTKGSPSFYTDPDGGQDIITMPKSAGIGYKFSTLSTSHQSNQEGGDLKPRTGDSVNKFDMFAFAKNGYCCTTSILNPAGRLILGGAFKAEFRFNEGEVPQMPPIDFREINDLYWYAFSPYGHHGYAAKDKNSKLASWAFHSPMATEATTPTYSSLVQWLRTHIPHEQSALAKSLLVFGTGTSYFAKNENTCTWHDLPDILDGFLRSEGAASVKDGKAEAIPRVVALGAQGDHVAIMNDGTNMWSLNRKHFLRQKIAENADLNTWDRVALNPYNSRDYFLATSTGSVDVAMESLAPGDSVTLSTAILMYMQAKAKEDQRKYEVQIKAGDGTADISITPTSKWGGFEMLDDSEERRKDGGSAFWRIIRG